MDTYKSQENENSIMGFFFFNQNASRETSLGNRREAMIDNLIPRAFPRLSKKKFIRFHMTQDEGRRGARREVDL